MIEGFGRLALSKLAESKQAGTARRLTQPGASELPSQAFGQHTGWLASSPLAMVRALRPAQWLKNGLVFAGLVFGGKLFDVPAVANAILAALAFCLLSSGFYLINDVKDLHADRLHPVKRLRPVAAGEISPVEAAAFGVLLILLAIGGSALLNPSLLLIVLAYTGLMAAYNLGLKRIIIVDVFAIAGGFVLRAVGGAVAVDVSISSWLLICTMLLALLIGFGKRRHELGALENAGQHRRNLDVYSLPMLDQSVAITAAGTLIAYAMYTFDSESARDHQRLMLTIPIVAYGVFRYVYLLYHGEQGGTPETMLLTDRPLVASVAVWSVASALLFYFGN